MPKNLTFLMAQINPTVGAIAQNALKIISIIQEDNDKHDVIIFPELALTGYPPEDLLFRDELFSQIDEALVQIQASTKQAHVIVGHPHRVNDQLFNAASVMSNGQSIAIYHKQHLPNYDVFDEKRYFTEGSPTPCLFTIKNYQLGLCICEDIWHPGPVDQLIAAKTDVMICINASPFDYNKYLLRETLLREYAQLGLAIVYVNQVGGQDDLLFDGQSLALDGKGEVAARSPAFVEHLQSVTLQGERMQGELAPLLSKVALIYQGLLCGLKDYVEKNRFPGVVLGLSGGIDSALTLALAVDAFGPSRVHAVMMPSRYTAIMSLEDAKQQVETMGVKYSVLPIEPTFNAYLTTLAPEFKGLAPDITEENLQARIRGTILMSLSNKFGSMLLNTSNKSELAVGYGTLYGDMAGGFGVLKDVLKTTVYDLAHYRNSQAEVIPSRVLNRAPSAELAPNQKDQDSLPDYAILDAILMAYMEDNLSPQAIIKRGFAADDVMKIVKLIKRNEYKRRQAPPGVKISECAFGRDWRYPLTSGFSLA